MPSAPSTPLTSEISSKTRVELHWRAEGSSTGWYYRNDARELVLLDSTHTLIANYVENMLSLSVELHLYNDTSSPITPQVTANDSATVDPTGPQTVGAGQYRTWTCSPGAGVACPCGPQQAQTCTCASWGITGSSFADPTFKVRWKAFGDPPSSP